MYRLIRRTRLVLLLGLEMRKTRRSNDPSDAQRQAGQREAGNTLRLTAPELNRILDDLDASGRGKGTDLQRAYVRWSYRLPSVRIRVSMPDGTEQELRVACRNLSHGGVGILHRSFWHTGTPCTVLLPGRNGQTAVNGKVTRCNHVRGMVHEIGIQFTKPINAADFVALDPFGDCFSVERVDPGSLRGCILHIEDSEIDRKLLQHFLRQTELRIRPAETAEKGIAMAGEGTDDLILCDYHLECGPGVEVVSEIRALGVRTPIILVTADTLTLTRDDAARLGVDAFLAKPIRPDLLLRAIAEFLMLGHGSGDDGADVADDEALSVLLEAMIAQLHENAARLRQLQQEDDAERCAALCMQIKGSCPSLGLRDVARLADTAARRLMETDSIAASAKQLRELIVACEHARAPKT